MKISILTTSFPIHSGIAVGIHVWEQAKYLKKMGHQVEIIAPHHYLSKKHEIIEGIPVYRFTYFIPHRFQKVAYGDGIPTNLKRNIISKLQLPFFMAAFFFKAYLHSKNSDILHCHWTISGLIGVLISKLRGNKIVLSMHGAEIFVLGKNRLFKFILDNCDLVVCNSTFTFEKALHQYPETNCIILRPGTDTNRFYPNKEKGLRSKLSIPENDFFILTIGKFIPRKGIEVLLDAMNLLVNQQGLLNVKLRIGGRGYLKQKYLEKIREFNLESSISFLEYINDDDIPHYFSEADVFVLPAIIDERGDTEGLGVVLIEANACGTPVIASEVGGIKDVVKNGFNGLLITEKNSEELAAAIIRLIENPEFKNELGKNGRDYIKEFFSWQEICRNLEREYLRLLVQV